MPKKKEPCDFCSEDNWWTEEGTDGHSVAIEIYPENMHMSVTSFARKENGETEEIPLEFEMNYCPKCGRKLMW